MTFEEFVAGRSIAVVGPAPMPVDQSADIDGHDLVYRCTPPVVGGHYGTRIDIAFLNGGWGRTIYDDDRSERRQSIEPATWWVYKGSTSMAGRRDGLWRKALKPADQRLNRNQVTAILFDLIQFPTGPISVYGADLYAAGPGSSYHEDYSVLRDVKAQAQALLLHEPMKQMRLHRAVHKTGRVVGDDRYLAAVTMTDDEYQAVIDRWKAVLEEAEG